MHRCIVRNLYSCLDFVIREKIGELLTLTAIKAAKERGAKKIILYSHTKLHKAITLYRKLGFKEVALDGPYKRMT